GQGPYRFDRGTAAGTGRCHSQGHRTRLQRERREPARGLPASLRGRRARAYSRGAALPRGRGVQHAGVPRARRRSTCLPRADRAHTVRDCAAAREIAGLILRRASGTAGATLSTALPRSIRERRTSLGFVRAASVVTLIHQTFSAAARYSPEAPDERAPE